MNTIEIKDDEINVEEIMRQIRENIKKRRENGVYTKDMEDLINEPIQTSRKICGTGNNDLNENLNYINSNWDVQAEYSIRSNRPFIGRLLVWSKSLIHREVKRYVDLIAGKQSELNGHFVRILNDCMNGFDSKVNQAVASASKDIDSKVNQAVAFAGKGIDSKVDEAVASASKNIDSKVNEAVASVNIEEKVKEAIMDVNIENMVNQAVASVNKDIEKRIELKNYFSKQVKSNIIRLPADRTDNVMNYFLFEEKFRGSTEDIKKRQSIFVKYFQNGHYVLDIGCGRGEFLSVLKENGISGKGIDMDEDMVLYCKKNGLDVDEADALSYLGSLADKSLDGVYSGQVVEHLQPGELIEMVKLCHDKMKYGTFFIAETINPLCLSIFAASFYMDLSHVKPVHPETIKFLLESVGFRDIQFEFFSPFPEEAKLSKLEINESMTFKEKADLEAMNRNIDKLNSLLYGYQDYAVIGKK